MKDKDCMNKLTEATDKLSDVVDKMGRTVDKIIDYCITVTLVMFIIFIIAFIF